MMTPKEKAIEIADKFYDVELYGGHMDSCGINAKACVEIYVVGILQELEKANAKEGLIEYWENVKTEGQNL